jgi:drug/metabolite transporter (DMT)-like permease
MDVVLALLAAFAFAFGNVFQQLGTLDTDDGGDQPSFLVQILRKPVWLAGAALQACGWILQAIALDKGPLVVVQSITTLSLVIALPIGARLTNQVISTKVVIGACAIVAGIVLFLSVGSPKGGTTHPDTSEWVSAGLVTVALVAGFALLGRRQTGSRKALLFGTAAGFGFAFQSAVTKEFVTLFGHGVSALLGSWEVYVLIASAASGFVLQQSALKTGVLAPAIASSNAVTLFAGVVLGITVFGETLARGNGRLAPAILGLLAALVGVVLLAGAPPPQATTTGGVAPAAAL